MDARFSFVLGKMNLGLYKKRLMKRPKIIKKAVEFWHFFARLGLCKK